jgi:hypothetical protein
VTGFTRPCGPESLDGPLEAAHRHHVRRVILILAALSLVAAACGSDEGGEATGVTGTRIDVTLQEFAVLATPDSAPPARSCSA